MSATKVSRCTGRKTTRNQNEGVNQDWLGQAPTVRAAMIGWFVENVVEGSSAREVHDALCLVAEELCIEPPACPLAWVD